jgi:ketosteroid isomerase-like protein
MESSMKSMRKFVWNWMLVLGCLALPGAAFGQLPSGLGLPPGASASAPNPLSDTSLKPGKALLFDLEAKFAKATAEGGGKAFATWFAEDGVSLGNNEAPVHGRDAIAKQATWTAQNYQLLWTPTDAVMSPLGDMGYTWGHYEGHSRDSDGNPKVTTGRYLTIWRKEPDGSWKVLLDASQDEPAGSGECCKVPPSQVK